jgi:DUF4097 and DUF4098 domain-containing protein YvlB
MAPAREEVSKVKFRKLAFACGLLLVSAAAAESVDETIDAAPDGSVDISNTAGSIKVYGWSNDRVEVTGELGENVEELILERDGKRVTVKVKVPRNSSRKISSDIVVRLPEASSIDVSGVSADILVEGVRGEQSLHTVSGDVETEASGADLEVASVSGDVEVRGDGKDTVTRAGTVSGDVVLFGLSGEISAEAVSGDVTIDEGSYDRVAIQTVNGDLTFLAELRPAGRLDAESVNGGVTMELAGKVSAKFEIESFNGGIDVCFGPEPVRTSKYAPGWELVFTEGEGDGSVNVSTLNGSIRICN